MSAPTEVLGLVPNLDRRPGEWSDIRPHGTEARARRERRRGGKPCPDCLAAENAAHAYRRAAAAALTASATTERRLTAMTATELQAGAQSYVTEIWCPEADNGVHALHSHMREPEPLPEPEPELEVGC